MKLLLRVWLQLRDYIVRDSLAMEYSALSPAAWHFNSKSKESTVGLLFYLFQIELCE